MPIDAETGFALARLDDGHPEAPVLDEDTQRALDAIVEERLRSAELATRGLRPSKSLLLLGAPGTGKTMTARFVAGRLELPLLTVDLASVMSSYLGRTGQNLRLSLEYARSSACVLLIDEFDALAKRRDDVSDIGELKRLVNVLLLELDRWPDHAFLIAASNHPELLDRAISRRFDHIIELPLPGPPERERLLAQQTSLRGEGVSHGVASALVMTTHGWSGSDIVRLIEGAMRASALRQVSLDQALGLELRPHLRRAAALDRHVRDRLCRIAHFQWGLSYRSVAEMLGTTHPTVARAIRAGIMPSDARTDG